MKNFKKYIFVAAFVSSLSLIAMEDSGLEEDGALVEVGHHAERVADFSAKRASWDTLPYELKLYILSFLPINVEKLKEFFDYSLVSKDFASIITACDFSKINKYGFSAEEKVTLVDIFLKAAERGDYTIVKILIERGIDIESKNTKGYTALINAARNGHREIVELLLNNGANINAWSNCRSSEDGTALISAAKNGHIGIVKLLLDRDAELDDIALIKVASKGHIEVAELLLSKGANINALASTFSPLYSAVLNNDLEMVKLLLEHNPDIDHHDIVGYTPLILAAWRGYTEIVRLLLGHGAAIDAITKGFIRNTADTALSLAAHHGQLEVVKLLLYHGANAKLQSKVGNTALMNACMEGHLDVAEELLPYSEINAKNNDGLSALECAISGSANNKNTRANQYKIIIDLLILNGAEQKSWCLVS